MVFVGAQGAQPEGGHSCPPLYLVLTVALQAQIVSLECGASAPLFSTTVATERAEPPKGEEKNAERPHLNGRLQ